MNTNNTAQQITLGLDDTRSVEAIDFDPDAFRLSCMDVMERHYLDDTFDGVAIASSHGKDSGLMTLLAIDTVKRLAEQGKATKPLVIMTADTRVENPLVTQLANNETRKIKAYAAKHKLPIHFVVGQPTIGTSWAARIIGGRSLTPLPGSTSWCTSDWKITPLIRALNLWKKTQRIKGDILKCTGTRFSESSIRGRRMRSRNDSSTDYVWNRYGEAVLCPIADLSSDDVWMMLGYYKSGYFGEIHSDLNDLFALYAKAGNASCAVVADDRLSKLERGNCGGRLGCYMCSVVQKDLSLENMINEHPELKYVHAIRECIVSITPDYSKRNWFGRTIKNGYIKIAPDSYSPSVCQDLLRFCLTADAIERERANAAGTDPLFTVISFEDLLAVDAYWSLYGYAPPYEAWRIYKDVVEQGNRYFPPAVDGSLSDMKRTPAARYLYVGDWINGEYDGISYAFSGLRDLLAESLEADTGADLKTRTLKNGYEILDIERSNTMSVNLDRQDTVDFLQFILDDAIRNAEEWNLLPSVAIRTYLQYGVVSYHNMSLVDDMLRRVTFREFNGLSGTDNHADIMHKTVSEAEMKAAIGLNTVEPGKIVDMFS